MRWNEILFESVKKYLPMFTPFANDNGTVPEAISKRIASIETLLKREDRIVWALRWERLNALGRFPVRGDENRLKMKFDQDLGGSSADELDRYETMIRDHFQHWLSLPIAAIQNFVFLRQSPGDVWDVFTEAEERWTEARSQIINHAKAYPSNVVTDDEDEDEDDDEVNGRDKTGDIEKIIDFGNGWAWWDLNRAYCTTEGGAMGHCGNGAAAKSGETVLSLRYTSDGENYRPSATFILDKNGWLGEMKGRANLKPQPKYHDMIVRLLMDHRINGCKGGGYAAANNFSVLDLPEEKREELLAAKPTLFTVHDSLKLVSEDSSPENRKNLETQLRKKMREYGLSFQSIDFNSRYPEVIITNHGTLEEYIKYYAGHSPLSHLKNFFGDLGGSFYHIADKAPSDVSFDKMAQDAEALYFESVASAILPYTCHFALDGVNIGVKNGDVVTTISAENLLNPSLTNQYDYDDDEEEDSSPLGRISGIDEEDPATLDRHSGGRAWHANTQGWLPLIE